MTLFCNVNPAQKPASHRIKKIKEGKIIGFKLLKNFEYILNTLENTLIDCKKKEKKKLNSHRQSAPSKSATP